MSQSLSYHYAILPWSASQADERRFRRILFTVMVLSLGTGLIMPLLPRPVPNREAEVSLPPRYAKMLLEHEKIPLPLPKPDKAKPEPEDKALAQTTPEAAPKEAADQRVATARRKAASSGLLAMQDELADLRSGDAHGALNQTIRQGPGAGSAPAASGPVSRAMVTSGVTRGSGGIASSAFSANLGGGGLAGRGTTRMPLAQSSEAGRGGQVTRGTGGNGKAARSLEDIRLVIERNKAAIYGIYNRALRDDPTLAGKLVLQLKIAPSGEVLECSIASSELHAPEFERKLLARIRQFDFGAKDVGVMQLTYPLDFLPS